MFPSTDSSKNAADMFPQTGKVIWHQCHQLEPRWVRDIDVTGKKSSV